MYILTSNNVFKPILNSSHYYTDYFISFRIELSFFIIFFVKIENTNVTLEITEKFSLTPFL